MHPIGKAVLCRRWTAPASLSQGEDGLGERLMVIGRTSDAVGGPSPRATPTPRGCPIGTPSTCAHRAGSTRLSEIADEVDQTQERVRVTRNARDFVVLMSTEDRESLEASLERLSDPQAL